MLVRQRFHQALDEVDEKVRLMFALVAEGVAAATESFLSDDRETAVAVMEGDQRLDALDDELEASVEQLLLTQAPMASEYHYLVTVLRITPELERSGDLVQHIARRAAQGIGSHLPPDLRGTIQRLGDAVTDQWRCAADAFVMRDATAMAALHRADEGIDALARELWTKAAASSVTATEKMELALVARFYERLGDHACHITARLTPAKIRPSPER